MVVTRSRSGTTTKKASDMDRSMSGTAKKATTDRKKAVNPKVAKRAGRKLSEKTIKKMIAVDEKDRETDARRVQRKAREYYVEEFFLPQYLKEHRRDIGIYTWQKKAEIMSEGDKVWDLMSDEDKAPYLARAQKEVSHIRLYLQGLCHCHH